MAGFIPELWTAESLNRLVRQVKEKIHLRATVKDFSNFANHAKADTINIPVLADGTVVALPITEGRANFLDTKGTGVALVLDKEYGYPFQVSSIDQAQASVALRQEYTEAAAEAHLDGEDEAIFKAIVDSCDGHAGHYATVEGGVITVQTFLDARKALNAAGAPKKGRTFVVCAAHERSLYDIEELKDFNKIGPNQAVREGYIGKAFGFDIVMLNSTPQLAAGDTEFNLWTNPAVDVSVFYQTFAMGFGSWCDFDAMEQADAGLPGWLINIYKKYGLKELKPTFAYAVKTAA